jgi:hypothetical protein
MASGARRARVAWMDDDGLVGRSAVARSGFMAWLGASNSDEGGGKIDFDASTRSRVFKPSDIAISNGHDTTKLSHFRNKNFPPFCLRFCVNFLLLHRPPSFFLSSPFAVARLTCSHALL